MTDDDVIKMARESNLLTTTEPNCYQVWIPENLKDFAKLVAAAEREACAQAAEAVVPRHTECGNKIAFAIRERGAP